MLVLGFESTAHTFGVGIYDSASNRIIANKKAFYKSLNEGIVPRKAADHHAQNASKVLGVALAEAGISLSDIDVFAYAAGPGLGPCLKTGYAAAKYLSLMHKKPLVPVNHCHAHIETARWQLKMKNPLALYVSGGNTQIVSGMKYGGKTKNAGRGTAKNSHAVVFGPPFFVYGETLDIGVGNLFDSFARELGEEFAHGSVIAAKAEKGKNYIELPYTVKGMNFAFSGLFTAAAKKIRQPGIDTNDLCFSLLETAFSELCEATERALLLSGKKELLVAGGVAQNKVLCGKLKLVADENDVLFGVADNQFNADNGAMIAQTGYVQYKRGKAIAQAKAFSRQKWRIDEVK